jgi:Flp pilus assembly protein TadG
MTRAPDAQCLRQPTERGAVTAEFAVALPAVLLLLAMLLSGAAAGVTQLRLEEGARAGARALARGDDSAAVERIVRTLSGTSASATVAADGEWLSVTVTDRVGGPLGSSIPWTLRARASTRNETAAASPAIFTAVAASPAIPTAVAAGPPIASAAPAAGTG